MEWSNLITIHWLVDSLPGFTQNVFLGRLSKYISSNWFTDPEDSGERCFLYSFNSQQKEVYMSAQFIFESFLLSYFDLRGVKCNAAVEVDLCEKDLVGIEWPNFVLSMPI